MGKWLGTVALVVMMMFAASGPAAPQADDLGALDRQFEGLYRQGRYAESAAVGEHVLKLTEQTRGPNHPATAAVLNNLANVYSRQGRTEEALKTYERALTIEEKVVGPDHPDVAGTLNNLGLVYQAQGRYEEALRAYDRALAITEKALGSEHVAVARILNNLSLVHRHQGRYEEALNANRRALSILAMALGSEHPDVGIALRNRGNIYKEQGRTDEALKEYQSALAIEEKALGPDHPEVAGTLNNLAVVYRAQGRYEEALKAYERALTIEENVLGPDHPEVAGTLNNLAVLHLLQRDWARAHDFWQRSTQILEHRTALGAPGLGQVPTAKGKSEAARFGGEFRGLIKAVWRSPGQGRSAELTSAMFLKAQWAAASEAAEALAQMAVRGAKGDPKLAPLVRERQDLLAEWQKRDEARTAAASIRPDRRNKAAEAENVARIGAIEASISEIDKMLKDQFPDYAALANVAVASIAEVQAVLRDDEALLMFLDTDDSFKPLPDETFIWVVTKSDARWVRSDLGMPALTREVSALRCGLDREGAWFNQDGSGNPHCTDLLKVAYTDEYEKLTKPLPFDLNRAHTFYKALFGQIEDLIKDKHLLIVPSGPLTQLPFQVLITEEPKVALPDAFAGYRDAAWLVRKHAITVLPAVSSLKALRELAKQSHASEPFIGFGNPLLDGDPDAEQDPSVKFNIATAAKQAREKHCDPTLGQRVAALFGFNRGTRAMTRGVDRLVDVEDIRRQMPLPETADELCAVAHDLGVDPATHLYLGARATEAKVKQLSDNNELQTYKIVAFATHGAVAGDISESEPGLILTPPKEATENDDGYLSAPEIAGLKLDADWAILSACNTAAGGARSAEALSGLARAFFYAGARALLVSHWEVNSYASVKLITQAVDELKSDRTIGRAEALRRSMLKLMAKTDYGIEGHPAFWAPFVVVGEGASAR
jgi:CHAT domain-containing protein/Tfp pilus assembly protein PilF